MAPVPRLADLAACGAGPLAWAALHTPRESASADQTLRQSRPLSLAPFPTHSLALIAAGLAWMASMAHKAMAKQTVAAMWWPEDGAKEGEEAHVLYGYLVFVGIRLAMVLGAALLVYWQVSAQCVGSCRCSGAARLR